MAAGQSTTPITLWVVTHWIQDDGTFILGIYDTKEAAEACFFRQPCLSHRNEQYHIDTIELNKEHNWEGGRYRKIEGQ